MADSTEAMANDVLLVQIDSGGLLASAKRIIAIFVSKVINDKVIVIAFKY
jgi:hypothetical protein